MKPLVYDYGSLSTDTEQAYIHRIVENHASYFTVYPLIMHSTSVRACIVLVNCEGITHHMASAAMHALGTEPLYSNVL